MQSGHRRALSKKGVIGQVEVNGKKFSIIGGGISGIAAARLLRRHGAEVFITEKSDAEHKIDELKKLGELGIEWEAGQHSVERTVAADAIILSPGVTPSLPVLLAALKRDIPLYSEIEAAYWFSNAPIVAVTGTNGKTTVTTLIGEILKHAGKKAVVAGNIGTPFSDVVDRSGNPDMYVLELSSYQLERISTFHAHAAVLLNISPDHLERYRSLDEYVETKFRITLNQTPADYFIYNADDRDILWLAKNVKSKHIPCSLSKSGEGMVGINGEKIFYCENGNVIPLVFLKDILIPGKHNLYNVMASAAAALIEGAIPSKIGESIAGYRGMEHRIEFVATHDGRVFYNDSKGTNVDATHAALETVGAPTILIAGGKDKNSDLAPLDDLIREKVKILILLGEAANRMDDAWRPIAKEIVRVRTMEEAVETAWKRSGTGDTILLSPACSSFDMFRDFEERGEIFKSLVKKLIGSQTGAQIS